MCVLYNHIHDQWTVTGIKKCAFNKKYRLIILVDSHNVRAVSDRQKM